MNKFLNNVFRSPEGEGSGAADGGAPAPAAAESAPASAPAAAPAPAATATEPSIADILNFDPFEKPEATPVPAKVPAAGKKAAPAVATTPARPAAEAPIPAAKPGEQPVSMADLQNLLRSAVQPARPAAADGEPKKPAAKAPRFNMALPQQVHQALLHDDPAIRERAFNGLVTATMNTVFDAVLEHIEKDVYPRIGQTFDQRQAVVTERNAVTTDFYRAFPDLDQPEYRDYVMMEAMREAQTMGTNFRWTPEFRNKIGTKLRTLFKLTPPAAQQQQQVPAPVVPAKPRYNGTGGPSARPTATEPNDIIKTIFG